MNEEAENEFQRLFGGEASTPTARETEILDTIIPKILEEVGFRGFDGYEVSYVDYFKGNVPNLNDEAICMADGLSAAIERMHNEGYNISLPDESLVNEVKEVAKGEQAFLSIPNYPCYTHSAIYSVICTHAEVADLTDEEAKAQLFESATEELRESYDFTYTDEYREAALRKPEKPTILSEAGNFAFAGGAYVVLGALIAMDQAKELKWKLQDAMRSRFDDNDIER